MELSEQKTTYYDLQSYMCQHVKAWGHPNLLNLVIGVYLLIVKFYFQIGFLKIWKDVRQQVTLMGELENFQ